MVELKQLKEAPIAVSYHTVQIFLLAFELASFQVLVPEVISIWLEGLGWVPRVCLALGAAHAHHQKAAKKFPMHKALFQLLVYLAFLRVGRWHCTMLYHAFLRGERWCYTLICHAFLRVGSFPQPASESWEHRAFVCPEKGE